MPEQDLGFINAKHRPEQLSRQNQARSTIGNISFPAVGLTHSILFVFKEYSYDALNNGFNLLTGTTGSNGRSNGASVRRMSSIELPFPTQLSDSTGLVINNFERDKTTEAMSRAASSFVQSGGTTVSDIPDILQQLGAGVSNMMTGGAGGPGLTGNAQKLVQSILGKDIRDISTGAQYLLRSKLPGDISRSIDITTGQTVNPRETLSFDGVELRTFSFNWQLFPESQEDSSRIKAIVNGFKQQILPHTKDIEGVPRAYLTYPAVVEAFLIGVDPTHFVRFKPSLIRNIDVDYSAAGLTTIMKGGKPGAVNLSISMQELEIQTADEYGGSLVDPDIITSAGAG